MEEKKCCQDEQNLEYVEIHPGVVVKRCKICGSKHYEMTAEPGDLGLQMR